MLPRRNTHHNIERFELLVATLGHQYGVYVLNEMAKRLSQAPWNEMGIKVDRHLPFCFGVDTFAIVLTGRELRPLAIAEITRKWLGEPLPVGGQALRCAVNIGVASRNEATPNAAELLRNAEAAHYHARQLGAGRIIEFEPAMQQAVCERVGLERDLCHALDRKQIQMVFQPIVSMADGSTVGGEALMRWHHPKRGHVAPSDFIAIAEESDLIIELGEFALRESCALLRRLDELNITDRTFWLSVNLSRRQLLVPNLPERLLAIVSEAGVEPNRIKLEVTESVIMTDAGHVPPLLGRIRELGFKIAMDDFGTGQSSLSCLHQFPIDTLKIDRAFITKSGADRQYAAVVYSIVTLAHNMGMNVVAEGIETQDQIAQLQALECDLGQGYVFSRPQSADHFIDSLRQDPATPE